MRPNCPIFSNRTEQGSKPFSSVSGVRRVGRRGRGAPPDPAARRKSAVEKSRKGRAGQGR
jgi:hypothetical protein